MTCPFCLAQWAATALVGAHRIALAGTRAVATVQSAVAGADALQFLSSALQRLET